MVVYGVLLKKLNPILRCRDVCTLIMSLLSAIKFIPKGERELGANTADTVRASSRRNRRSPSSSSDSSSSDSSSESSSDSDSSEDKRRAERRRRNSKKKYSRKDDEFDSSDSSEDEKHSRKRKREKERKEKESKRSKEKKDKKEKRSRKEKEKDREREKDKKRSHRKDSKKGKKSGASSDEEVDLHALVAEQMERERKEIEEVLQKDFSGYDDFRDGGGRSDAFERFGRKQYQEEAEVDILEKEMEVEEDEGEDRRKDGKQFGKENDIVWGEPASGRQRGRDRADSRDRESDRQIGRGYDRRDNRDRDIRQGSDSRDRYNHRERDDDHRPSLNSDRSESGTKEFDSNKFRSLLSGLKGAQSTSAATREDNESNSPPAAHNVRPDSITSAPVSTNHGIAALLRSRLKTAPASKALNATEVKAEIAKQRGDSALETPSNADGQEFDYETTKQLLLLSKTRQLQQQSNDAATAAAIAKANAAAQKLQGKKDDKGKVDKDASLDIKTLIGREKFGNDEDMDSIFRDNVLRLGERYKGTELGGYAGGDKAGIDEEAEIDMKMFQRKDSGVNGDPMEAMRKKIAQLAKEKEKMKSIVENCPLCVTSHRFPKHLVLSQSEHVMVKLKAEPYALTDGHLEILPIHHQSSFIRCEEEVQKEIERYKQCLQHMVERESGGKKTIICFENAVNFARRPHTCVEVVPVDKHHAIDIAMFVKQAFLNCDEEWAQQKKIIEIGPQKPLKHAVPTQFSYLAFEWFDSAPSSKESKDKKSSSQKDNNDTLICRGMVHPIENDSSISYTFCYDVVAGMLEEDEHRMRKGKPVPAGTDSKRLAKLMEEFDHYDWTKYM